MPPGQRHGRPAKPVAPELIGGAVGERPNSGDVDSGRARGVEDALEQRQLCLVQRRLVPQDLAQPRPAQAPVGVGAPWQGPQETTASVAQLAGQQPHAFERRRSLRRVLWLSPTGPPLPLSGPPLARGLRCGRLPFPLLLSTPFLLLPGTDFPSTPQSAGRPFLSVRHGKPRDLLALPGSPAAVCEIAGTR